MRELRQDGEPFDLAVAGESGGTDPGRADVHAEHAQAGATWWMEAIHPWRTDLPEALPWPVAARSLIGGGP